jgi:hypothetical protein
MSVCAQCGSAVSAADGFCTQCGARIKQTSRPDVPSVSTRPAGDPAGSRVSGAPVSQSVSMALPQWGQVTRNGWWLLGGVLLVFVGSLLPWAQTSVVGVGISSHPGGGAVVIFVFLVICALVAAWPLLTGALSKRRLLGTSAVVAVLTLFAITNWSDLGKAQQQVGSGLTGGFVTVSAGSGLLLYTVGVVVLCVLVVRLWLFRRRVAHSAA